MAKNPDYTQSAIELKNSNETKNALAAWAKSVRYTDRLYADAMKTPEYQAYLEAQAEANKLYDVVKAAIDVAGSYQDIETGDYAVKQRRRSQSYSIDLIKKHLPEWADKVIVERVDEMAMKGLLKGGLISKEAAGLCEVITEISPAYIIRFAPETPAEESTIEGVTA